MTTSPLWSEDPEFWDSLDCFVQNSWLPFKMFLEVLQKHDDELNIMTQAILFGGLGNFMRVYAVSRAEGLSPQEAFNEAVLTIQQDGRVQEVTQQTANKMIDSKVDQLKESE